MTEDDQFCTVQNDITICFRTDGDPADRAILLIAGLGQDLTSWPDDIVEPLVALGHFVIRIDNRDCGRSTRPDVRPPGTLRKLLARPRTEAYDLGDLAEDTIGLINHLGLTGVHIIGVSMGGMIGQTIGARHPGRVLTLTSIVSTTGARGTGGPARSTMLRMAKRPAQNLEQYLPRQWAMTNYLVSSQFPPDRLREAAYAQGLWTRGAGPRNAEGVGRQISAIQKSGDHTQEMQSITAPTLVVNGDRDLMVHPSGGAATAAAIHGSRHVVIPGMGHHFAPALTARLVQLIAEHVHGGPSVTREPGSVPTTGVSP